MSISGESSGGLATSPELLKNTPSNIARLEDAIEQCEARHKYRATTGSPSDGGDVRWYFCKVPLAGKELAASVPHTEMVGKSDYFRFSMRDSLALEASFLQREEELLSYWWKEYAESSAGPSKSGVTSKISSDVQLHEEDYSPNELYTVEEERVGVPVKGGLYEVDLLKRHCFPVYWDGENRRVLRGHWFARKGSLDWLPLREDISEQLELAYHCRVWHRRRFQQSGLFAARVDIQGTTEGLHALFTGEDDTWEAWLGVDSAGISLGWGKGNGFHLRRGFSASGSSKPTQDELRQKREEEMDDYCSQVPVGHLVFMVHGIGQRLEKANLVDDVGNFRHITARLAERFLSPYQRSIQRVLFIPCQWRKGLKLRGESTVEKITLDGVRGLRVTLGATAHDVLYYMSPIYCQDIIDSVSNQLNKLYKKFLKRNPGYDGKVSLYGHSLGSVLSYDILCHQESVTSPFPMESLYVGNSGENKSEVEQLEMPCQVQNESATQSNGGPEGNPAPSLMVLEGTDCVQSSISECSPTSELEQSCSIPVPGKDSADVQISECHQKADLHIGSCSSEEDHVKDLVIDNGATCDDTHEVSDGRSEDHYDKDEVISLLKEEVQTLKLKIAELEKMKQSLASKSTDNIENSELLNGKESNEKDTEHSSSMKEEPDDCSRTYMPSIHYTKLEFKVDTFFAVGSPLGVFLALRNIRIGIGRGQDYWQDEVISEEMPCCRQMFNIFHPFDPVAYRIEPLICKEVVGKRPVIIPYHRGGKRLHIGFQEFTEDVASRSHAFARHLNTMTVKVIDIFRKETNDMEESMNGVQANERTYGSIMMERLTGSENGRVDHMLQDKTFQHPYISALGSHTNYWRDHDTALFILKHLYRDIPEELDTDDELEKENSFEHKRRQIELFFQKEAMDEDLPLTFSDKAVIREFSRKARKSRNPPR